jgi:hypothetical protein
MTAADVRVLLRVAPDVAALQFLAAVVVSQTDALALVRELMPAERDDLLAALFAQWAGVDARVH